MENMVSTEVTEDSKELAPVFEPIDLSDSKISYDSAAFISELQQLCVKHNMTIFNGALGLIFIPRDEFGTNIEDTDGISCSYWSQAFGTKEFMKVG